MTNKIKLDKSIYTQCVNKLHEYLLNNHELDLGQFETEFLLDFIIKNLGPELYNAGIECAIVAHRARSDMIEEEMDLQKII